MNERIEAGAQALANDIYTPHVELAKLPATEAMKFRRQARIVLNLQDQPVGEEAAIFAAAKALKIAKLRSNPDLDDVAVKLNCEPMDCEVKMTARVAKALQLAASGKSPWDIAKELDQ